MDLICGINPVLEALAAGTRHFDRLLIVKGSRNQRVSEAVARASQQGIPLRFEARETLDRMAGGLSHQGIMAVVSAKPVIDLEALLDEARTPALVVLLDGVEDPRNLGAVLRTAEAAGADGVLLPERHSAGLSEAVSRASAGGLEHVKVARIGNVAQAIETLKSRGLWVVGFDAAGTERWDKVDYRRPLVLVLGGEGRGMRRLVRERCDHLVSLPLFGHVGSLNVSVAAGIALYEVIRQRGAVPSHVRPIRARSADADGHIVGPGPNDGEHDPGHGRPRAALPSSEGDEAERTEEGDEPAPRFIDVHEEEAAWAGPPQILKAAPTRAMRGGAGAAGGGPRGPHGRRGRRFRKGKGGGRPPGGPPAAAPPPGGGPPHDAARTAEGPQPPGNAGPARRRKHRRGRRDHPAHGPTGGPPPGGNPPPPQQGPGSGDGGHDPGAGPQNPAPAGEGVPNGPRPHRGRRRRRRR
jgi:23S rRNA (guanosine2251-2'-O)-methyltransferase